MALRLAGAAASTGASRSRLRRVAGRSAGLGLEHTRRAGGDSGGALGRVCHHRRDDSGGRSVFDRVRDRTASLRLASCGTRKLRVHAMCHDGVTPWPESAGSRAERGPNLDASIGSASRRSEPASAARDSASRSYESCDRPRSSYRYRVNDLQGAARAESTSRDSSPTTATCRRSTIPRRSRRREKAARRRRRSRCTRAPSRR